MFENLVEVLKANPRKIVYTEGTDARILESAARLKQGGFLTPILVGNVDDVKAAAKAGNFDIEGLEIIDPANYDKMDEMAQCMFDLRKGKMTMEEVRANLQKGNYFGTMLVKMGVADALLGGATYSTADTVRPALQLIKTKKGVNVPGVHLSMPYMSQRDRNDILFGIEQGYDLISASFTRSAQDIMDIRHLLDEHNANIRIIAKIENQEGIDNIDEILSVADGIMVARGDMGVEIDYAEIPSIQKHLIDHAMQMGKICITATQMLDSMIVNPRPTRAEITDVANAIYDGTGAVMLSGETAAGKYPVEALKAMAMIAETTESDTNYESLCHHVGMDSTRLTISAAVSHAACTTASDISASAIITASKSGETARLLSRFRPDAPIIACVLDETTCRQMNVYRGVTPLLMDYAHSTDELISMSVKAAEDAGLIHSGDRVVVTAGVPVGVSGTTNMIKVHLVGDTLLTGIGIGLFGLCGLVCAWEACGKETE